MILIILAATFIIQYYLALTTGNIIFVPLSLATVISLTIEAIRVGNKAYKE